jgi:hypothetical protein
MTKEEIADQVLATVPKGWELVRYGKSKLGDQRVDGGSVFQCPFDDSTSDYVIVKRKMTRVVTGGTWMLLDRPPKMYEPYWDSETGSCQVRQGTSDAWYADAHVVALEPTTYAEVPEPTE